MLPVLERAYLAVQMWEVVSIEHQPWVFLGEHLQRVDLLADATMAGADWRWDASLAPSPATTLVDWESYWMAVRVVG